MNTATSSFFTKLILSLPNWAWLDCPYGRVNDPFPGLCQNYIDTNQDQLCDHSQAAPIEIQKFLVLFLPLALYFLTKKLLTAKSFKLFWNLVLLITFTITAVTAFWIFFFEPSLKLSFWHNYAGIVTIEVGLLHLLTRLYYFKGFLKKP